jgi:hypothetical protein
MEEKAIEDVPDDIIALICRRIQEAVEQRTDKVRNALIQQLVADVRPTPAAGVSTGPSAQLSYLGVLVGRVGQGARPKVRASAPPS